METIFFYKNMNKEDEQILSDYVTPKINKIEKILSHFPQDAVLLHIKGERFEKHSAYEVELVLKLPIGTFTAKEASHMITKAVDLAKDRLDIQLKKALSQLREHRSIKARSKSHVRVASLAL